MLAALWAKPAVKLGLVIAVLLAIAALVVGVIMYLDGVRQEGFDAGAAQVKTEIQTQTIVIQKEIRRAEDSAPRTPAGVSKRLREGTF